MGRVKRDKPRSTRSRRWAENPPLATPGDPYSIWYELAPNADLTSLDGHNHSTLPLLLELYQPKIPEAAFVLDYHIQSGTMPMRSEDNSPEIKWIPCADFPDVAPGDVRRVIHALHIRGLLLINDDGSVSRTIPATIT